MRLRERKTTGAIALTILLASLTIATLPSGGDTSHLQIPTSWMLAPVARASVVATAPPRGDDTLFEARVRPLLLEKCGECHGPRQAKGGLRLDSAAAVARGGGRGRAIVPGNPEQSLLIQAIEYRGALKMPPAGPLSPREVEALTLWVKRGAIWPSSAPSAPSAESGPPPAGASAPSIASAAPFWSFQPVRPPAIPQPKLRTWLKSPLDAFILSALEAKGLGPAAQADRRTLIRRATFDLTGLPPTPAEIDAFLADQSPGAWEHVVDRLLASPRYGERWGRHWLDVARYADSADARGLGGEGDISEAWRYRDWVIDAFNRDMPYNQFVMNQIAGDLLPPTPSRKRKAVFLTPTPSRKREGADSGFSSFPASESGKGADGSGADINVPGTIATGLLAIGNWGNGDADKDKILTDIADDQVDIVSRGFMGLTVGCARCHDHKFDPITTKDYYGLAGIFFSTHILPKLTPKGAGETPLRVPLETAADRKRRSEYTSRLAQLDKQVSADRAEALKTYAHGMLPATARYLAAAWEYAHQPPTQSGASLAKFAADRGLKEYALRQWRDYLGNNDYRLMAVTFEKPQGIEGVYGFHGPADLPSLTVNANTEPKSILTYTLPPRSVCVHPGPVSGAAVGWKSPITGTIEVTGSVTDADPACGNGIEWMLDRRGQRGPHSLATGGFENGGAQEFAKGKGGAALGRVAINQGECIEVLVLPQGEYSCDTTVINLTIREVGGTRTWNLAQDVLAGGHRANPEPDRYGNADVWRFYDMAASKRASGVAALDPLLAAWRAAVAPLDGPATVAGDAHTIVERASAAFQAGFALEDSRSPFWINRPEDEANLPTAVRARLTAEAAELAELRKSAPPPVTFANAAQEGGVPESPHAGVHDVRVHIRGSYARLGDLVPRHFPVILAGAQQPPITQGSGRLELAKWIASDNHPLTARVMVNRIWQHHFGQGIVRTPSNFGKLGERPTNQHLLDYLATEFVRSGWSIKHMHRAIMLSATYQQSSVAPAKSLLSDPDNRLFGRMNRSRLESEALRDNLLSVSGTLDAAMGGPAYRDFKTPRRTVYYMTVRSDRSGFGPLFDAADPTATMDHRTNSNVAPQALFLMNDPFTIGEAKVVAQRLVSAAPDDPGRIANAYVLLYGRPPTAAESALGLAFLQRMRVRPEEKSGGMRKQDSGAIAWEAYTQILLCANEFLYVD